MGASRHLRLPRRTPNEEVNSKQQRNIQTSSSKPFSRSASALARHRPHQLSEIREVSDSCRTSVLGQFAPEYGYGHDGTIEALQDGNNSRTSNNDAAVVTSEFDNRNRLQFSQSATRPSDLKSLAPSALSLPLHEIPRRRSSMTALSHSFSGSRQASLRDLRTEGRDVQELIYSYGRAESPVKLALQQDTQSSEALRASPSRTFIRTTTPFYLLEDNNARNPRLDMSVRLPSSLFVGGGTVEGQIEVKIDASSNKKMQTKELFISRLSVDIIGVEEVEDGRRRIFLCLATELFDDQHPPPATMVLSQTPERGSELYWKTRPSTVTVPFCVNLPLKLGPPPYSSRQANIRYLLCPSAVIKIGEKRTAVRQAWPIQMLTVHDPDRALSSLPNPLLATDILVLSHKPMTRSVKLTAGLHRQTWVGGGAIFTDIHIINSTDKVLKRIDLELEKSVLWFAHSAAGTLEKRANNLRLPAKIDTEVVCKTTIKKSKEWNGVVPRASEVRTCELEIPKGHVTIGDGRFFEVRYFVKVSVMVGRSKAVSVQLPVTVIPINSLDIVPNSLAQVAASIEAKRSIAISRTGSSVSHQPHSQGQAYTTARQSSLRRAKRPADSMMPEDVETLTQDVDDSPRRIKRADDGQLNQSSLSTKSKSNENTRPGTPNCHRHPALRSSCYHCHLLYLDHATKHAPHSGPRLPRLQVSTSGLGFSESEFEIAPDSPRKVMLSETERQMINQQRELRLQRQWSQQKPRNPNRGKQTNNAGVGFVGWKNVAMISEPRSIPTEMYKNEGRAPIRQISQRGPTGVRAHRTSLPPSMPGRRRSRTIPEATRHSLSDAGPIEMKSNKPAHGLRYMERGDKYPWSGYNLSDNDVFGPDRNPSRDGASSKHQEPVRVRDV